MSQLFSGKDKVSQVPKNSLTRDAFLLGGPISVAGQPQNEDPQRYAPSPATEKALTCNRSCLEKLVIVLNLFAPGLAVAELCKNTYI